LMDPLLNVLVFSNVLILTFSKEWRLLWGFG
jgi:hypothetical protein